MSTETYSYFGAVGPRHQQCSFCYKAYDALRGPARPHGVCAWCWPEVLRIEEEDFQRRQKEEKQ